jgi:hypothetical protein
VGPGALFEDERAHDVVALAVRELRLGCQRVKNILRAAARRERRVTAGAVSEFCTIPRSRY